MLDLVHLISNQEINEGKTYTTNSYYYMEHDNLKKNYYSIHIDAKSFTLSE